MSFIMISILEHTKNFSQAGQKYSEQSHISSAAATTEEMMMTKNIFQFGGRNEAESRKGQQQQFRYDK